MMLAQSAAAAAADRTDEIRTVARSYIGTAVIVASNPNPQIRVQFLANGDFTISVTNTDSNTGTPNADEWHRDNTGVTGGAGWSVRATLTAGTAANSGNMTAGTWYAVTSTRTIGQSYQVVSMTPGSRQGTFTFDFSLDGGSTILVTVTGIIIRAEGV